VAGNGACRHARRIAGRAFTASSSAMMEAETAGMTPATPEPEALRLSLTRLCLDPSRRRPTSSADISEHLRAPWGHLWPEV
jgi:hypothetical protein